MDRRSFIRKAGVTGAAAAAAATLPVSARAQTDTAAPATGSADVAVPAAETAKVAAPAVVDTSPKIKWRCASSFPKTFDPVYGSAETTADFVRKATDGNFDIEVFAAGEIVPGPQAANAAAEGTVEMAQTASSYSWGKDPTYALGTAIPFGLNARLQNAWFYHGGGQELMNAFYATEGLIGFPCGNTGSQMGGWFRQEINSVADLQGLKMRIGGISGKIIAKLGVVPQQIADDDLYRSLEKGTIDAAEWSGPYEDEKLGFNKVAQYYYYPGWWEGGPVLHNLINLEKFNALPKSYQVILDLASRAANSDLLANYDSKNPAALKRLVKGGAQLRQFSPEILEASYEAAKTTYAEISAENPMFGKIYEHQLAFKKDAYLWMQFSEHTFDTFMMIQQRTGKL